MKKARFFSETADCHSLDLAGHRIWQGKHQDIKLSGGPDLRQLVCWLALTSKECKAIKEL